MTKTISSLKLANSILVGGAEKTMLLATEYDMQLDGVVIRIECRKKGDVTHTTLMNTAWWKEEQAAKVESVPPKAGAKAMSSGQKHGAAVI